MKNGKHKALINDDRKEKTQIQTTGPFCQRDDQAEIGDWWQEWLGDKAIKNHHISHSYFGDKDIRHHIRIFWENTESFLLPSLQITQTNRLKLPDSANKWLRMPELLQSGGRRWILRRTNSCLGMVSTTNSPRPLVFHEDCLAPKDCVLVGGH